MTPWDLVKRSEHSHQRAVFAWANCAAHWGMAFADDPRAYDFEKRKELIGILNPEPVPDLVRLFAVHNQGHGDAIRGAQAKAEGVKKGVPDICWPRPVAGYGGLWIELKRPKTATNAKGLATDEQSDWGSYLTKWNYRFVVAVGWTEAVQAIKDYWR
jgi:hypothetical protein